MTIQEYEYETPNDELDQFDDSWTDAEDDGPEINHKETWMVDKDIDLTGIDDLPF